MTDGYTAYDSWVADLPEADRPGRQICWAHVRRNFVRCAESSNDPEWSKGMVELIRPPYTLERLLREGNAPPGTVLALRQEISLKLVQDIFDRMEERLKSPGNPPLNALRRAIDYALERREILKSWLDNPDIPIDNNTAERAVRPSVTSRSLQRAASLPGSHQAVPCSIPISSRGWYWRTHAHRRDKISAAWRPRYHRGHAMCWRARRICSSFLNM